MSEAVKLGQVVCDFMGDAEFEELCRGYVNSHSFHHIVTLNPEMVMLAERSKSFRDAAAAATLRVPDGSGLVWARWYLRSEAWPLWPSLLAFLWQKVERVTGVEAVMMLGKIAAQENKKIYLLGGSETQRKKTAMRLLERWQNLDVAISPDHIFDPEGPKRILDNIIKEQPVILLVAYGAPKQTWWIERHRLRLPGVRIAIGVGGAFAILSEELPRAPNILRKLNLEWLWRLYLEPARLKRIWRATIRFPLLIRQQKMDRKY